MKKLRKGIVSAVVSAVVVAAIFVSLFLCAGGTADVLKTYAVKSFGQVIDSLGAEKRDGAWRLESPDGKAALFWGGEERVAGMRLDLAPFLAAGLDLSRLPDNYVVTNGVLTLSVQVESAGGDSAAEGMEMLIGRNRGMLGYHSAMGHFNLDIGNGNKFEWAQNAEENDKDIVFALAPEPLIAAGVRAEEVAEWSYGTVEMHEGGKTTQTFLFLKAFDLVVHTDG